MFFRILASLDADVDAVDDGALRCVIIIILRYTQYDYDATTNEC